MNISSLSEASIRRRATAESFNRGQNYYRQGAVISLVQRGNVVQAEVEGSQHEPYRVRATFDKSGVTSIVWIIPTIGTAGANTSSPHCSLTCTSLIWLRNAQPPMNLE